MSKTGDLDRVPVQTGGIEFNLTAPASALPSSSLAERSDATLPRHQTSACAATDWLSACHSFGQRVIRHREAMLEPLQTLSGNRVNSFRPRSLSAFLTTRSSSGSIGLILTQTGGMERWLYRLARKHGGGQQHGWSFDFDRWLAACVPPWRNPSLQSRQAAMAISSNPLRSTKQSAQIDVISYSAE